MTWLPKQICKSNSSGYFIRVQLTTNFKILSTDLQKYGTTLIHMPIISQIRSSSDRHLVIDLKISCLWNTWSYVMLFCFCLNFTHLCNALRLSCCIIHLKVRLHNHWPKYALRRLYSVDSFTQPNVDNVTLVGARIVCSSMEKQQTYQCTMQQ